jgi:hypothetical protein
MPITMFPSASLGRPSTKVITSDYTILDSDFNKILLIDATSNAVTATLPTAVNRDGKIIVIKAINVDNLVTVDTTGAETIDGVASLTFILNQTRAFMSDDSDYLLVT